MFNDLITGKSISIKTEFLPVLMKTVSEKKISGTLQLGKQSIFKNIYIIKGIIIYASSEFENELLGEFLIRQKTFDREVMDELLRVNKSDKIYFSDLVVSWGFLTKDDLKEKFEFLVKEILYDPLFWQKATLNFLCNEIPEQVKSSLSLKCHEIYPHLDFTNSDFIRSNLPPFHMLIQRNSSKSVNLDGKAELLKKIWLFADGLKSIGDVIILLESCPFLAAELMISMIKEKMVLIFDKGECSNATENRFEDVRINAKEHIAKTNYTESVKLHEQAFRSSQNSLQMQKLFFHGENQYFNFLQNKFEPYDQIPILCEDWERVTIENKEEGFLFSRIDGRTSLKELFALSGLERFKTLIIMKKLLDNEIISLRPSISPKILIVDDDPSIVRMLSRALNEYDLCVASNGEDAMILYFSEQPQLIILDIMIPKISGWEVCQRIKEVSPATKIIILTAYSQYSQHIKSKELKADSFMTKPVKLETLKKEICIITSKMDKLD